MVMSLWVIISADIVIGLLAAKFRRYEVMVMSLWVIISADIAK